MIDDNILQKMKALQSQALAGLEKKDEEPPPEEFRVGVCKKDTMNPYIPPVSKTISALCLTAFPNLPGADVKTSPIVEANNTLSLDTFGNVASIKVLAIETTFTIEIAFFFGS